MMAGAIVREDGHGIACLVPMPEACGRRADALAAAAERLELGQGTTDVYIIARRLAWDAHAAAEYPRPLMSDCVDLARAWPVLARVAWHLAAGAIITVPGCDCQPPAHHRDELVNLAAMLAAHELRTAS